ncbi:MAG: uroporphyrinogen decarboxylase family protein [Pirellulales bacterium]
MQFRAGAHIVVLADGMASATLLPRGMFTDYAFLVIQQTIRELDGMVGYEAVGRAEPFVDLLADSGAVALLIGEEDNLTLCKKKAMSKVALIANINNMKMRRWSSARVELQSKLAISEAKDGYGFILANQDPEIPFDVPIENIDALIRSIEKYGRYDLAASVTAA